MREQPHRQYGDRQRRRGYGCFWGRLRARQQQPRAVRRRIAGAARHRRFAVSRRGVVVVARAACPKSNHIPAGVACRHIAYEVALAFNKDAVRAVVVSVNSAYALACPCRDLAH